MSTVAVSSLFFLILLKHCIVDLWMQSLLTYQQKKFVYASLSTQIHYLQHGIGTVLVLLFFIPWPLAILFGIFDHLAHWHIDFLKSSMQRKFNIAQHSKGYWFLSSIDQGLHYLTYYIIILLVS